MLFVNKYTSPDLILNYAEEFLENQVAFVYSVGYSEKGPVIIKTRDDGTTVWQKELSVRNSELRSIKVIQLKIKKTYHYVVSIYDGKSSFLLSLDQNGTLGWLNEVALAYGSVNSFLLAAKDKKHFFFIYSSSSTVATKEQPVVLKFDDAGNLDAQVQLENTDVNNEGLTISTAKAYKGGIVLGGQLISKDQPLGIIIELNEDLKLLDANVIAAPSLSIQDLIVNDPSDYTITAYGTAEQAILLSTIEGEGSAISYEVPETSRANSLITDRKGQFYVAINALRQGVVHRFKNNFKALWSKKLVNEKRALEVKSIDYLKKTDEVTATLSSESILLHTGDELDSCLTVEIDAVVLKESKLNVKLTKVELTVPKVAVRAVLGALVEIPSEIIPICDTEEPPCEKDEKICDLYNQMLEIFSSCFPPLPIGDQMDFNPIVTCGNQILDLIADCDKQLPEYDLSTVLRVPIKIIKKFVKKPSIEGYEDVYDAIRFILFYLYELGNCDCGEGDFELSDFANLQSNHLYLQSAGSIGDDSTKGIHLRWVLKEGLDLHLPKGNYAVPNINFNKNDDYVKIYRAEYQEIKRTLSLSVAPGLVDNALRNWVYDVQGELFYVNFINTAQYDSVLTSIDPTTDPVGFMTAYGDDVIEIESKTQLSFAMTLNFTVLSSPSTVDLELLSVAENKVSSPKRVTLRQAYATATLSGTKLVSENIRSVRFIASNAIVDNIEFELYGEFLSNAIDQGAWEFIGEHALSKDTNLVFNRLEPVTNVVHGNWLRYNDDANVNVDNYKTKWNSPSLAPENRILDTISKYITLSDNLSNPAGLELIYFNDPVAAAIPGFDPSENQFELSYLHMIKLASLDYHIARMVGLGVLDLETKIETGQYIYLAEYTSFGDLDDGLGAREVQHLYCSLPTGLADQRLPLPIDLKPPVPGIFQALGTEAPTVLTDPNGYSADGKTRFLSLFHEDLPEEAEDAPFFDSVFEFISAEGTIPVFAGIEYKLTSDPDYVKPELAFDQNYFNIDSTVSPANANETRNIIIPEIGFPVFVHREKQNGFHDYGSYGINWFSRATTSPTVHTIETVIEPTNLLQPPTNINAVLIREENPLLLTSVDEQVAYSNLTAADKTFIRLVFEYNHGQELIDYHKEIDGVEVSGYFELPDAEELFAEDIEVFFRNEPPNAVSGQIVTVVDDVNPLLSIITTGDYDLTSQGGELIIPSIPSGLENNFVGSALTAGGVTYIIHLVNNTGATPVFTVFKNDAEGFPVDLGSTSPIGPLVSPTANDLFIIVENMLSLPSWGANQPMTFLVNVDHTTIYNESVTVGLTDGTTETHVQKFRGIYEDALIEKVLEDHDGDEDDGIDPSDTPRIHLGLYKMTFSSYVLAQHSQGPSAIPEHSVEWYNGLVRVHTTNDPNGPRKELKVIRTENIDTANNLVIYAVDATFVVDPITLLVDPLYDQVDIGVHQVNYYPGYKTYLYEDAAHSLTETDIHPGANEQIRYSIFGLRSHDVEQGFYSKISQPILMYAQKIEPPLQPRVPVGGLYATRPDFFGKASYTFTTIFEHVPHAVQYGRASDIQILSALWLRDDGGDPLVWTVKKIQEEIFEKGEADWYIERWQNLLGFDYTYALDPGNDGLFEFFLDGTVDVQLPLPNSQDFIDGINAFIVRHNADFGTTISPITTITSLYQIVIPLSPQNAELQIVDFIRDIVHNTFVPLTEIPVLYEHIKGLTYKPIPKKQKVRDRNGELLSPADPEFDMAPMMKVIGPDPGIPSVLDETQFTDFGIDGASNAKYFYISREFNLQMRTGPYSPVLGPVSLVNTAPPRAPEVVKITAVLESRGITVEPGIVLELNSYMESQNIVSINIYRATQPQNALSIRTMDLVKVVDVVEEGIAGDATWKVKDEFSDLGYVPYGDPLFYMITVSREIKYNDRDQVLVEELQPSEPSKMTVTNIVENYNPESPVLTYFSDPITPAKELNTVTFRWEKTVYNGKYLIHKQNSAGVWVKIHEVQTNDDIITVTLLSTDLADDTLIVEDVDGNTVYHAFKVVAENFAGMISPEENILSIYNVGSWNDIANL
jgi:hypothetical protein